MNMNRSDQSKLYLDYTVNTKSEKKKMVLNFGHTFHTLRELN